MLQGRFLGYARDDRSYRMVRLKNLGKLYPHYIFPALSYGLLMPIVLKIKSMRISAFHFFEGDFMKAVSGVFDSQIVAENVVSSLLNEGFIKDDISLLMSDHTRNRLFSSTDDEANRAAKGAVAGASIGVALGAIIAGLTAAGAIVSSGGVLLASGPIVAALSGAGAGAVAGGLAGALIRAGFAADEAGRYEEEIKHGKAVVIVHADSDHKAIIARNIFKNSGAITTKAA